MESLDRLPDDVASGISGRRKMRGTRVAGTNIADGKASSMAITSSRPGLRIDAVVVDVRRRRRTKYRMATRMGRTVTTIDNRPK